MGLNLFVQYGINASTVQPIILNNYGFIFYDNLRIRGLTSTSLTASTSRIPIINNSIIINEYYTYIVFYDINETYLGWIGDSPTYTTDKISSRIVGDISHLIPANAHYFYVSGARQGDNPAFTPYWSFSEFQNLIVQYQDETIGTYELLYDSDVSASLPATQIDITGLNITKDDELRMVYTFVGDSSSNTADMFIRVNDIVTNYHVQYFAGDGSSFGAFRSTSNLFSQARSNRKTQGFINIKLSENGNFVGQSQYVFSIGADAGSIANINHNIVNTNTLTSITKLSIISDNTNGIAAGSRFRLYKINGGAA